MAEVKTNHKPLRSQVRAGQRLFLLKPVVDAVVTAYGVTLHPKPLGVPAVYRQQGVLPLTTGVRRG